jgi:hypothetical protein
MAARKLSGVMMRRKSSEGLLDTADDLAEKLDCLGDILEEIDHKYSEVSFCIRFKSLSTPHFQFSCMI